MWQPNNNDPDDSVISEEGEFWEQEEIQDNMQNECEPTTGIYTLDLPHEVLSTVSERVKTIMYRKIKAFTKQFASYARQITVLGFRSSSYDIQLILKEFVAHFGLAEKETKIIKQSNKYVNIKT